MTKLAHLPDRAVLAVSGADRVAFLNGLVSNDVAQAAPGRAVWAALLTPQGRYLADFFVFARDERLLLDCEAGQRDLLATKLTRFRLRAAVAIEALPWLVFAAWDGAPAETTDTVSAPDPRLPEAGWRVLSAAPLAANAAFADWDAHRLALGLPDGTRDLEPDRTLLLEAGFDELNGVSWTKGCYMGQELTARTRYRGLLKRRLVPVEAAETVPPPGTVLHAEGREAGEMRSGLGRRGLAMLRIEALEGPLLGDGISLRAVAQGPPAARGAAP